MPSRRSARATALLWAPLDAGSFNALGVLRGLHTLLVGHAGQPIVNRAFQPRLLSHPRPQRQRDVSRGPLVPPPHRRARCGDHEYKHLSHSTCGVHRVHHGVHPLTEEETLDVVSSSQAAPLAAADCLGHCPTSSLSSSSSCRRTCPHRAGIFALHALASSP